MWLDSISFLNGSFSASLSALKYASKSDARPCPFDCHSFQWCMQIFLMEFPCVGTAGPDTFCLLGAADLVLLTNFLFSLRATLARSIRKLSWGMVPSGSGTAALHVLGPREVVVGPMVLVFPSLHVPRVSVILRTGGKVRVPDSVVVAVAWGDTVVACRAVSGSDGAVVESF
ncbi:hypothetical protein EI94DRAFT_1712769 [Lactarius quietus]|nr:hypothetical protein EI94DRAFT_1712769 [Lactarius quietus]